VVEVGLATGFEIPELSNPEPGSHEYKVPPEEVICINAPMQMATSGLLLMVGS
jgi:hypothetical protein